MSYSTPCLSLLDTTTQSIATAGTPQVVTFDTTILANKIVKTSTSRFTFNESAYYEVQVNFQALSTSAGKILDLWFRVNGTDVANSLTKNTLVNANDEKDITHTMTVSITAGQYIEVWINGDSTNLSLSASVAGVTPTRPAAPSIFLSIQRKPT